MVSESQRHSLVAPFSAQEVKIALWGIDDEKAPGIDGPGLVQVGAVPGEGLVSCQLAVVWLCHIVNVQLCSCFSGEGF
ncbi:hypothetical protein Dimus_027609 [Dionaea muscipula]